MLRYIFIIVFLFVIREFYCFRDILSSPASNNVYEYTKLVNYPSTTERYNAGVKLYPRDQFIDKINRSVTKKTNGEKTDDTFNDPDKRTSLKQYPSTVSSGIKDPTSSTNSFSGQDYEEGRIWSKSILLPSNQNTVGVQPIMKSDGEKDSYFPEPKNMHLVLFRVTSSINDLPRITTYSCPTGLEWVKGRCRQILGND